MEMIDKITLASTLLFLAAGLQLKSIAFLIGIFLPVMYVVRNVWYKYSDDAERKEINRVWPGVVWSLIALGVALLVIDSGILGKEISRSLRGSLF